MKKETDKELIFRERVEMMSLLTTIKNQTTDQKIKDLIKKYFSSKYGLYDELKKKIPYYYRIIDNQLYNDLAAIAEDICTVEDAIRFLLNFYRKNMIPSKAQEILTQEDSLQILMRDCNNANHTPKGNFNQSEREQ